MLVALYAAGDLAQRAWELLIPGPILGQMIALCLLSANTRVSQAIRSGASVLLPLLPIFLIPIGVGIVTLSARPVEALIIQVVLVLTALVLSTILVLLIAHVLFRNWSKESDVVG